MVRDFNFDTALDVKFLRHFYNVCRQLSLAFYIYLTSTLYINVR